jgi:hypothetical protein
LKVNDGGVINVAGTLTNNGNFTIASTGNNTRLVLAADTTLSGVGATVLGNSPNNHVTGSHTLTIANGHTLAGGGQVGSTTFGPLNQLVNQGTLRADASTGMSVSATTFDNSQGVVQVADGSFLTMQNGTLSGGTINGVGSAYLEGGIYSNTTLTGTLKVNDGGVINVAGTLTNNGNFTIASTGNNTRLVLAADATLSGVGATVLGNSPNNHITGSHTLTIANGHTLSGGGQVGSTTFGPLNQLVNQGTLRADASSGMSVSSTTFDNRGGKLEIASNTTLTVLADVLLDDNSSLKIDVVGLSQGTQYGLLQLGQNLNFDGVVELDLSSFAAQVGDSFTFLTLTGTAVGTGAFDDVFAIGYDVNVTYFSDRVTATISAVTPIPEPQTWGMLLAGLGFVTWRVRCQAKGKRQLPEVAA